MGYDKTNIISDVAATYRVKLDLFKKALMFNTLFKTASIACKIYEVSVMASDFVLFPEVIHQISPPPSCC
jgi:hypothetical protein